MSVFLALQSFCTDIRTIGLVILILGDLLSGVATALRTREFKAGRVADWYFANVVPYGMGFLFIYLVTQVGGAAVPNDLVGFILAEIGSTLGFAPAAAKLSVSIGRNLAAFKAAEKPESGSFVD